MKFGLKEKPKAASAEKNVAYKQENKVAAAISQQDIARRAYQIWQQNGCTHGHDAEDWLKAKSELCSRN